MFGFFFEHYCVYEYQIYPLIAIYQKPLISSCVFLDDGAPKERKKERKKQTNKQKKPAVQLYQKTSCFFVTCHQQQRHQRGSHLNTPYQHYPNWRGKQCSQPVKNCSKPKSKHPLFQERSQELIQPSWKRYCARRIWPTFNKTQIKHNAWKSIMQFLFVKIRQTQQRNCFFQITIFYGLEIRTYGFHTLNWHWRNPPYPFLWPRFRGHGPEQKVRESQRNNSNKNIIHRVHVWFIYLHGWLMFMGSM